MLDVIGKVRVTYASPTMPKSDLSSEGLPEHPALTAASMLRGAVKIDLEDVLRVRRVYIAMHLNGDIASGRPGATSYRADFR